MWFFACVEPAIEDERCFGALIELLRWRKEEEARRREGKGLDPEALRRAELEQEAAAVARLRPHASSCERAWQMGLWSTPDEPALRVRDEALRTLLGLPGVDYPAKAWAGTAREAR